MLLPQRMDDNMPLFDMHCHVDLMSSMICFAKDAIVNDMNILAVTTTPKAFEKEHQQIGLLPNIRIALGIHPQLIADRFDEMNMFERYISTARYIGEVGLDFHNRFYHSKDKQTEAFRIIISWCSKYSHKVISIHSVWSDKNILDILEAYNATEDNICILHWFSGSKLQLNRAIGLGCYFSVNSYMLNTPRGVDIIKLIPADRLTLESDAPFLSEISTIADLKKVLTYVGQQLILIKGNGILQQIEETSKQIFYGY